jgi:catalase
MSVPQYEVLTTADGEPVSNDEDSITVGANGPILLQDYKLIDKLAHFDRERIPERVVHAKGAGAFGYLEITHDISKYCQAKIFDRVGKRTPCLARFSTVGGEKGSADTARDPRGFAIKFYTEEGNWDMTGNNTPVFFIRDPSKFPDFIHTQKRHPQTNCKDHNMFWDFLSLVPESNHQVTILMSDRGIPRSYRHMNGYSSHTFKFINAQGLPYWVKLHFKTEQGIENWTDEEGTRIAGEDPDYATNDLFQSIEKGEYPAWRFYIQVMEYNDAFTYKWNPFDVTKVWPHKDYPLIPVGRLVLDRNPKNYFAEIEQASFSPSSLVRGIEPSPDKMLQGRLFSYPDSHRHRLGPNYLQIPVNCPYATKVNNYQRDGFMAVNGNGGSGPNYQPNSFGGPKAVEHADLNPFDVHGVAGRFRYTHPNCDYEQAGNLYRLMTPEAKSRLVKNIVVRLQHCRKDIQDRMVAIFTKCDKDYGSRIKAGLLAANPSAL